MIQDLHSHTYYSFCGKDAPQTLAENAIAGGIELLGICDHNYGIGYGGIGAFRERGSNDAPDYALLLQKYFDHITTVRDLYRDRLTILRGVELCTLQDESHRGCPLPDHIDISHFDYCLIENLDAACSCTGGDLFAYAKRCATETVGVAHTDLFTHIQRLGVDPLDYFKRMADQNIFWEMNINFDSIHRHREHPYVSDFLNDPHKQAIVRESGVRIAIGFDGHRVEDYLPKRVQEYNRKLDELGILKAFEG